MNRENWLEEAVKHLNWLFKAEEMELPEIRVSVGWPSKGGLSKKRVVGQCWAGIAAKDGKVNIFISPMVDDAIEVLTILTHEMVHAWTGPGVGHKGEFVTGAKAVGLVAPWTSTPAGEDLIPHLTKIADDLGDYPHSALNPAESPVKKQTTRMKKASCACCDYTVRLARKWVEVAVPRCPNPHCDQYETDMEVDL